MISTQSPIRNGERVTINKAQNILESTLQIAKKAIAATATKPVRAVHKTCAETPRRSSTNISALPMINQRRTPRSGNNNCAGNCG